MNVWNMDNKDLQELARFCLSTTELDALPSQVLNEALYRFTAATETLELAEKDCKALRATIEYQAEAPAPNAEFVSLKHDYDKHTAELVRVVVAAGPTKNEKLAMDISKIKVIKALRERLDIKLMTAKNIADIWWENWYGPTKKSTSSPECVVKGETWQKESDFEEGETLEEEALREVLPY